jgi:hypothetical protein
MLRMPKKNTTVSVIPMSHWKVKELLSETGRLNSTVFEIQSPIMYKKLKIINFGDLV